MVRGSTLRARTTLLTSAKAHRRPPLCYLRRRMDAPSLLVARLERFARRGGTAVIDDDGTRSFAAIEESSRRVAAALLGGRRSLSGQRVALLVTPGAAWVEAFFGVLRAGGCAVILSPLHPA